MYHNFVKPHLGLPEHSTSGEAAGIIVGGNSKIATLIQAAAKAGVDA